MKRLTRPLGELPAGVRFRLRPLEITGRVLEPGRASVGVEIDRTRRRDFTTRDGKRVTFETHTVRTRWVPATEVEVLS